MIDDPTHIYIAGHNGVRKYRISKVMPKTVRVYNYSGRALKFLTFRRTKNVCFTLDEAIEETKTIHQSRRQLYKIRYDAEILWDYEVEKWEAKTRKELK